MTFQLTWFVFLNLQFILKHGCFNGKKIFLFNGNKNVWDYWLFDSIRRCSPNAHYIGGKGFFTLSWSQFCLKVQSAKSVSRHRYFYRRKTNLIIHETYILFYQLDCMSLMSTTEIYMCIHRTEYFNVSVLTKAWYLRWVSGVFWSGSLVITIMFIPLRIQTNLSYNMISRMLLNAYTNTELWCF